MAFCALLFLKDSKIKKVWKLDFGMGAKRPLNRVRNTDTKKTFKCSEQMKKKKTFFAAAILHQCR